MPIHPDVAKLIAGGLPGDLVLVGGQAAIFFAQKYCGEEPVLKKLQELTSTDSDFLGTRDHFPLLSQRLGVKPQIPPRKGGMFALSLARFYTNTSDPPHAVEVLRHIRGVREQEILRTALHQQAGPDSGTHFSIINPVLLLEAKAANVMELDQQDRNDSGHLWIAAFATRAYLRELNMKPDHGRALVTLANRVLDLADSHRGIDLLERFQLDVTQCLPKLEPNHPSVVSFLQKGLPERLARIRRRAGSEGLDIGLPLERGLSDPPVSQPQLPAERCGGQSEEAHKPADRGGSERL